MGEAGRRKRRARTNTEKNRSTLQKRSSRRARRRRARLMRRVVIGAVAVAAVALVVLIGVLAVRNTRKRKAEEEASRALATDVADMPFSAAATGNTTEDSAAAAGETTAAGGASSAAAQEAEAASVHVDGVDAFSLYRYDETSGMRVKCARHESAWTAGEDIVSLEAFASDSENIVLNTGGGRAWYEAWLSYWQQETGSESCRIGYDVSFDLKSGEHIHAVLLKPGDELSYRPYLENYLYDDAANADAGWYSHLEPDDLSETMLLTSIKFTPGERFEEIDNKITVTGFVYDALEDFDYDGNYIGDVLFTTELVNQ